MFIGESFCSTDSEGWLTIPPEFREQLATGATVTRGIDRCLVVYPADGWKQLATKMEHQLPVTSAVARAFNRLLFSGASACVPGRSGKIRVPESLREYAGIRENVVIVGLFSHLEIWSPERWQRMRAVSVEDGVALARELAEFGI